MKKILSSILICLSLTVFGQTKFTTYQTSFTGETYNSLIRIVDSTDHMIFVDMFSLDPVIKRGGIAMDYVEHLVFLRLVSDAKTKYENWVKTAKANGVKDLENRWIFLVIVKLISDQNLAGIFNFQPSSISTSKS